MNNGIKLLHRFYIGLYPWRTILLPCDIYTCYYIENCLYLHDSYITKFDFMNYAFAKLQLARL